MYIESDILTGPAWGNKTNPDYLVIFLHGYGADGHDLIGLAPEFSKIFPNALFLSPDAPTPCEMSPFGHQWFSLGGWDPQNLDTCLGTAAKNIDPAADIIRGFIAEQLVHTQLKADRCVLIGFSQGCMTALHTALSLPQPLGAVIGFSGMLVTPPSPTQVAALKCMPICLLHGDMDVVVPSGALDRSLKALRSSGMDNVSGYLLDGLGHGINPDGISHARQFLKTNLLGSVCGCGQAKCQA